MSSVSTRTSTGPNRDEKIRQEISRHDVVRNLSRARKCIKLSTAPYHAYVTQDTRWRPGRLEETINTRSVTGISTVGRWMTSTQWMSNWRSDIGFRQDSKSDRIDGIGYVGRCWTWSMRGSASEKKDEDADCMTEDIILDYEFKDVWRPVIVCDTDVADRQDHHNAHFEIFSSSEIEHRVPSVAGREVLTSVISQVRDETDVRCQSSL